MLLNLKTTAVLTIDLQNDFLHIDGAYGRAGQSSDEIVYLPARLLPVIEAVRRLNGYYISAQFTLVPGPKGPIISSHLKALRPFLTKGDFEPGTFGHDLFETLKPADFTVEKVAYSAFWQSRLDYILRTLEIDTLIIGGIVTNGGVASTLRDAHVRNLNTILLTDGCAAFQKHIHDATLLSLSSITNQLTCSEALVLIEGTKS